MHVLYKSHCSFALEMNATSNKKDIARPWTTTFWIEWYTRNLELLYINCWSSQNNWKDEKVDRNRNNPLLRRIIIQNERWMLDDSRKRSSNHFLKPRTHRKEAKLTIQWISTGDERCNFLNPGESNTAEKYCSKLYRQTEEPPPSWLLIIQRSRHYLKIEPPRLWNFSDLSATDYCFLLFTEKLAEHTSKEFAIPKKLEDQACASLAKGRYLTKKNLRFKLIRKRHFLRNRLILLFPSEVPALLRILQITPTHLYFIRDELVPSFWPGRGAMRFNRRGKPMSPPEYFIDPPPLIFNSSILSRLLNCRVSSDRPAEITPNSHLLHPPSLQPPPCNFTSVETALVARSY